MSVDEFIREKILPEYHPVVAVLRELMRKEAPNTEEMIYYGLPMWKGKLPIAYISPSKTAITFSFTFGVRLDDKYKLLKGKAKHARFLKLRSVADIEAEKLRYYIRQAARADDLLR